MSASANKGFVFKNPFQWLKDFLYKFQLLEITATALTGVAGMLTVLFVNWQLLRDGFIMLFYTSPLWILYLSRRVAWHYWIHMRRHEFIDGDRQKGAVYEIRIPKDVQKSPFAMEVVFNALYIKPSLTTAFQRDWRGHVRPWWSFEIVSDGGELKFYIWCWKRFQFRIEAAMYAQYPGVQLVEVEDYAAQVKYVPGVNLVTGTNFVLKKPDTYPLKTYFDFDLHKDPKAEYRIDPFAAMIESMCVTKPGEKLWLQILVQYSEDEKWKSRVKKAIDEIYTSRQVEVPSIANPDESTFMRLGLKPLQYEMVKSMERSTTKNHFDVGLRAVYSAPQDIFRRIPFDSIMHAFKYYSSSGPYYNAIGPFGESWLANFDFPWEDFNNIRANRLRHRLLDAYTKRSIFHPPYKQMTSIMTSEELATIFHIPGEDSKTLNLTRLESKRGNPPPNLPF
ncbi:MAG: hypothetical protein WAX38_03900 [Minisyncoccia bacterium]